jgi:hypothetical protein
MHDEAVTASSTPGETAGRYLPDKSADSYGPTELADGGYYLADLTLETRLVQVDLTADILEDMRTKIAINVYQCVFCLEAEF